MAGTWALAISVALAFGASSQAREPAAWPVAADVPTPETVTVGLAGQGAPDITRFLLVRGAQPLLGQGDDVVALSPDGETVAYIDTATGEPQIWLVDAKGRAPRQVTFGEGVDEVRWSPDGAGLIYEADVAGNGQRSFTRLSADGRREAVILPSGDAFTRLGDVSADGKVVFASTSRNGADFDIYVTDLNGAAPRLAHQGGLGLYPAAWRPGAREVLLRRQRGEDGADVLLLDVQSGEARTLLQPKTPSRYSDLAWAPDGSGFYMASNQDRDLAGVAFYDVRSSKLRWVETPDAEVQRVGLSGDGRWLAWTVNRGGASQLSVRDLTTGALVELPRLPLGVYEFHLAGSKPVLAVAVNGPRSAGEVFVIDLTTRAVSKPVSATWAGLDPAMMVEPEHLTFKARDGVTLNGLFYRRAGVSGPAPLLLKLHGGPSSYATAAYSPEVQYYVSRGIAVFDFNYRGSTGYGKAFAGLNDRRLRPGELDDVVDATRFLAQTGRADPRRMAVGGRSYGGYLTNAVIGAYPELFAAAVSQVGVSDWVNALQGASPMLKASDLLEYGNVDDPGDRAFFEALSPLRNAARIRTPLLIQHGANDPQDPVAESDRLVTAIRQAGGEVTYIRFPDEGHGIISRANRVHYFRRAAAFLQEKLGIPTR